MMFSAVEKPVPRTLIREYGRVYSIGSVNAFQNPCCRRE